MSKFQLFCSLALGGALFLGCTQEESTPAPAPTTPTAPAPTQPTPQATGTGTGLPSSEDMKAGGAAAADAAKTAGDRAAQATGDAATATGDAAKNAADATKTAAGDATDAATGAAGDAAKEGQTLIDQIKQHISAKRFDQADTALTKLEGMKDRLPAALSAQIPTLRTSLTTARSALGGTGAGAGAGTGTGTGTGTELPKLPDASK